MELESHTRKTVAVKTKMIYYKSIIITLVAVAVVLSKSLLLVLIQRCKKFREDVTFPLLMSLCAAGLTQGLTSLIAAVISWMDLTNIQLLIQFSFYFLILSGMVDYFSLSLLSTAKFVAVIQPFFFRQKVTAVKLSTLVILLWIVSIVVPVPVLFYPDMMNFNNVTLLPQFTRGKTKVTILGGIVIQSLIYSSLILLVVTNLGLFIVAMRHAIQIRVIKRKPEPVGVQGQKVKVILMSLWAAKGVMVVSLLRLSLHLPFFIIRNRLISSSEMLFYSQWCLLSGPIWDVLCFIGCSDSLRQLVWHSIRCKSNSHDNQIASTVT